MTRFIIVPGLPASGKSTLGRRPSEPGFRSLIANDFEVFSPAGGSYSHP